MTKRILIVEDETMIQEIIKAVIDKNCSDVEVTTVDTGEAAIEAIKESGDVSFQLAFIDNTLNGSMNGVEVARFIKSRHALCVVVFMSGELTSVKGLLIAAIEAGIEIPLPKPFSVESIQSILYRFVENPPERARKGL
jgi:DNA-binding NtrC family response regulator